ncbi:hypothetical protein T265_04510 [Opisthorchis viverrini]|uniref:Uncharacterized protein n=1 Tax=Opisthorchis viverrini TaxID=6198 RepID=A0A074ZSC7_OPIVI|nr:hypothetical protein T265_04510 [Opisthorchis viverrini]KER28722.1 hypothetical protein T265_04510 [Opisthorchis viverrini]
MSGRTAVLLKTRRNISAGPEHKSVRRIIRSRGKVSVRPDRSGHKKPRKTKKPSKPAMREDYFSATGPRKPPVYAAPNAKMPVGICTASLIIQALQMIGLVSIVHLIAEVYTFSLVWLRIAQVRLSSLSADHICIYPYRVKL